MSDPTEAVRREMVAAINSNPSLKEQLEQAYGEGNVWDTEELSRDFTVEGFMAPFCVVIRKSDDVKGSVMFQHDPRFYYNFTPA